MKEEAMGFKDWGIEFKECSRCGGCGRYSWNYRDGDTCFGCNGSGWQITKRGAAAVEFYKNNQNVPSEWVEVGDKVFVSYIPTLGQGFLPVTAVGDGWFEYTQRYMGREYTERWEYGPDDTVRRAAIDPAELEARRLQAVEYQSMLAKSGNLYKKYQKERAM
jgi:hypothetical protein